MSEKSIKRMCKLERKQIEKQFDAVLETVRDPAYICRKCAHVANRKTPLCKPKSLNGKA